LLSEHLPLHYVEEIWLSLPKEANMSLDVTEIWHLKVKALEEHVSQIGDVMKLRAHMASKDFFKDKNNVLHYEEIFYRIIFSNN
jgi:LmbE family N-acetylglucosaminyl deacetylase